ncbi:hypothetical protein Egran_06036 [Elaphomyces granulatus]|uniref:Uncharacterized protein n=1 Tax=Elaphomyces granulatus TaxID=519963 RepID=A0A232LPX5_9EURO|nr:hypothetical protein Egran_06036 [Elaphomyces granulatus]
MVLISGYIVILFSNCWRDEEELGGRTVYNREVEHSSESYGSGASLGLKLKCITVPTHAFVKLFSKKSKPYLWFVDFIARAKSALSKFIPARQVNSGPTIVTAGGDSEYPLGKKSLGSGDFYDGWNNNRLP